MASPGLSSPLATTWNQYRDWALTARELKARLDRWRQWTLVLAIGGAVLVMLGQQLGSIALIGITGAGTIGKIVGLGGAAAIALSTYFASEALSNESVKGWVKCRSAAESLKASTYLYRAGVPPFDGADRDQKLIDRRTAIEDAIGGTDQLADHAEDTGFDPLPLSADEYYDKRVKPQIRFYNDRSEEYQTKTKTLRNLVFWLGAIAVVLGVASAIKPLIAGWTAVIATVTAAISSHIQSERYQSLIATYQETKRRLETLTDKWVASGKTDGKTFIQACEDTMALENGGWVTQWSQQKPTGQ
jgi:hypothetical protein